MEQHMPELHAGLTRRQFSTGLAALATTSAIANPAIAQTRPKVVIIGGGPGGATVAGTLIKANPNLSITIIEPNRRYTSCFFSNHYIAGLRPLASLTHDYDGLRRLGVNVAPTRATGIDLAKKMVTLATGQALPFDRLVVAPGIDFKFGAIEGYDADASIVMPHAWHGVWQLKRLHTLINTMPDGGLVLIAPPKNPYRCPPGPYERACAIANYLKTRKPKSKLIIVDPKLSYSKQPVFEEAYNKYYKDIIEVHLTNDIDDMSIARVEPKTGLVVTKSGQTYKAAVANIIPDQRAGEIAVSAGLAEGDWCPVDVATLKSTKSESVYVLGDSAAMAEMPKSAFSAHNQAKFLATSLLAELNGAAAPSPHFRNTCWSLLALDDSVKIGADYAPGETNGKRRLAPSDAFVSKRDEKPDLRKANYLESLAWYDTLTADVFAKADPTAQTHKPHSKG